MDPAVDIMNFLVDNDVCATIFATGVMSETDEGRQVMAIIRDNPQLFEIANHTMYHCDLARGGGGSPTTAPCAGTFDAARIRTELTDAEAILRAGTGQSPQPYWRPPYGSLSQAVIDAAAAAGYTKTFLWDVDTIDWKPISQGGPTAAQIAAKVINNAVNGSNVLFHLGGYETLDALAADRARPPGPRLHADEPLRPAELADRDRRAGQGSRGRRAEIDDQVAEVARLDPGFALRVGHRLAVGGGVQRAGQHAVDANARGLQPGGERQRPRRDRRLGRGVRPGVAAGLQGRLGADRDDRPGLGLAQLRKRGEHRFDGRPQARRDLLLEVGSS